MEFHLTRVVPACFLLLQESGNRVVFGTRGMSTNVRYWPQVMTGQVIANVGYGENRPADPLFL